MIEKRLLLAAQSLLGLGIILPEKRLAFLEKGEQPRRDSNVGIGGEKQVLDPPDIAIRPDPPAPVTERLGRTGPVLLGLWLVEELHRFGLRPVHQLQGDPMVDHLEEPELLAGSHEECTCVWVGQVDGRDPGECISRSRHVGFDRSEEVKRGVGQDHHGN